MRWPFVLRSTCEGSVNAVIQQARAEQVILQEVHQRALAAERLRVFQERARVDEYVKQLSKVTLIHDPAARKYAFQVELDEREVYNEYVDILADRVTAMIGPEIARSKFITTRTPSRRVAKELK